MSTDNTDKVNSDVTNETQGFADGRSGNFLEQAQNKSTDASTSLGKPQQVRKTLNIDGQRPIDPGHLEVRDTLNIDGHRPIAAGNFQVQDTLDVDGQRPIASSDLPSHSTLNVDGHRPIDPSDLEVKDTLNIDGHRPVAANEAGKPEVMDDYE